MASKEANAYRVTAEDQLKDAGWAFREESYALCAFLSASAAENATSALLITWGATPSKKHRNSLVLHRLAQTAFAETRSRFRALVDAMKTLEPHITKARYPVLKGLELLPPSKFYTEEIAKKALAQAQKAVEDVKAVIRHRRAESG